MKAILGLSLAAVLALGGVAAAKTGQSPDCRRFCMTVEPRTGPEGSVFRFTGRRWRPQRRVIVHFTFRLRAGGARPGDADRRISSGSNPSFRQRAAGGRIVSRSPHYRVILPD